MAREFKGNAGTIYLEKTEGADNPWDVWYEDFCIIGQGKTELEALNDAANHLQDIGVIVSNGIVAVGAELLSVSGD